MPAVPGKLKSRAGASMVIALVFFLVCAMVGGVVLTAASVNAGRAGRERAANQRRLAVLSAAELVKEDLQSASFSGAYRRVKTVTTTYTYEAGTGGDPVTSSSVSSAEKVETADDRTGFAENTSQLLRDDVLSGLRQLFYSRLTEQGIIETPVSRPADPISCRLSFQQVEELNIPAVTGTLTVQDDYSIVVSLTDSEGGNPMTLTFTSVVSMPTESTTVTNSVAADGMSSTKVTTTYYTTAISWDQPLAAGGAVS